MMQQTLKLCNFLHPADVGAVIDRPRATNSRPYGFYRTFFVFCNRPVSDSDGFDLRPQAAKIRKKAGIALSYRFHTFDGTAGF